MAPRTPPAASYAARVSSRPRRRRQVSDITPRNIERVAALLGGLSVQDRLAYQGEHFVDRYGPGVAARLQPLKRIMEHGIPLGAGTDGTRPASYNPWVSLGWMITGRTVGGTRIPGGASRLDRMEALRRYTVGGAWFSHEEEKKGSLELGRFADLAVLSDDYFSVPEDEISALESVLTLTGGRVVHACGPYGHLDPPQAPVQPTWSPVADERLLPSWVAPGPAGAVNSGDSQPACGCA